MTYALSFQNKCNIYGTQHLATNNQNIHIFGFFKFGEKKNLSIMSLNVLCCSHFKKPWFESSDPFYAKEWKFQSWRT